MNIVIRKESNNIILIFRRFYNENKYINKMEQLVNNYIKKTKFKNLKETCSK